MQLHQSALETQEIKRNMARVQEERDQLIVEGDDHAELQSRKHENRLR